MKFFNIKKIIARKSRLGMIFPFLNFTFNSPFYLLLHITLKCNRTCSYCYQQDDFYQKEEMPLDVFANIMEQRSKMLFKPYVHLFGGEPLFYSDLSGIEELLQKYNVKISLTTNGDFIKKQLNFLSMSFVKQINISINPPEGKLWESHLNDLLEVVLKLKEINPTLSINLNYNLNPHDYSLVGDVYLFLKNKLKAGIISVFVVQHFMHPNIADSYDFDCDKIDAVLDQIGENNACFDVEVLPPVKDIRQYYRTDSFMSHKCYVPFLGVSIFPQGEVSPGGGVFGCNYILGNLHKSKLINIWKGQLMKNFKNTIRGKLPKSCARCCQKIYG